MVVLHDLVVETGSFHVKNYHISRTGKFHAALVHTNINIQGNFHNIVHKVIYITKLNYLIDMLVKLWNFLMMNEKGFEPRKICGSNPSGGNLTFHSHKIPKLN